jgi:uncharacterized protein
MNAYLRCLVRLAVLILVAALLAGIATSARAQAAYPQRIDPTINDFAGVLSAGDRATIISVHDELMRERGVELVVATIGALAEYDVPDQTIEAFATGLFNSWGIGDRTRNDGVLLVLAVRDRKVRIELGKGYGPAYDSALQELIERDMLPQFRAGAYGAGVVAGAHGIPGVLALPPGTTIAGLTPGRAVGGALAVVAIAGAVGLIAFAARKSGRRCAKCRGPMRALLRAEAQPLLTEGQLVEERIDAMHYTVWRCRRCQATDSVGASGKRNLTRCPSCHYRTLSSTSTRQPHKKLKGRIQVRTERHCYNCNFHDHRSETLPKSTGSSQAYSASSSFTATSDYSSSSSSDYSSYSSSSSSDYSSSSSFDSGGSSSGDGASGSW